MAIVFDRRDSTGIWREVRAFEAKRLSSGTTKAMSLVHDKILVALLKEGPGFTAVAATCSNTPLTRPL